MRSLARFLVVSLVLTAPLACEKPAAQPATEEPSASSDDAPAETETPETDATEAETSGGESACDFTADPTKRYVGESPDKCAVMRFVCEEGTEYFADDCGCGCVTVAGVD